MSQFTPVEKSVKKARRHIKADSRTVAKEKSSAKRAMRHQTKQLLNDPDNDDFGDDMRHFHPRRLTDRDIS
jgi:hypothetical protein